MLFMGTGLKNRLLCILFMLFGIAQAVSQVPEREKAFRIGASLGYSFTGYRDETDIAVNRYLNTLTYILDGNIEKGIFFHSFNMGFFRGNEAIPASPLNKIEIYPSGPLFEYSQKQNTYTRAYLEYALDCRLWGTPVFPGYLGGAFRTDAYLADIIDSLSITGIISLNVHVSQKWIINAENALVFSAGFPVFGFAIRPLYDGTPYFYPEEKMIDLPDSRITGLHNYWAVFGDLKYNHTVNRLFSLYFGFGFELSRINFPQPRRDAISRINSGIAFTF